jgi:hypothetical protein
VLITDGTSAVVGPGCSPVTVGVRIGPCVGNSVKVVPLVGVAIAVLTGRWAVGVIVGTVVDVGLLLPLLRVAVGVAVGEGTLLPPVRVAVGVTMTCMFGLVVGVAVYVGTLLVGADVPLFGVAVGAASVAVLAFD